MSTLIQAPEWLEHAKCVPEEGEDLSALFFSNDLNDIAKAKLICAECPVIAPCLESALDRQEPWGVWGGQLFYDGFILPIKRRRGRPSKKVPAQKFPEVPVPEHLAERVAAATIQPERKAA